jgi:hypothetical protein
MELLPGSTHSPFLFSPSQSTPSLLQMISALTNGDLMPLVSSNTMQSFKNNWRQE